MPEFDSLRVEQDDIRAGVHAEMSRLSDFVLPVTQDRLMNTRFGIQVTGPECIELLEAMGMIDAVKPPGSVLWSGEGDDRLIAKDSPDSMELIFWREFRRGSRVYADRGTFLRIRYKYSDDYTQKIWADQYAGVEAAHDGQLKLITIQAWGVGAEARDSYSLTHPYEIEQLCNFGTYASAIVSVHQAHRQAG